MCQILRTAIRRPYNPKAYFDFVTYTGFLIFVLALPFGYMTAVVSVGRWLAVLGWVGRVCYERKLEWKRTALDIPIASFLILALAASFFAPHRSTDSLIPFWKLVQAVMLFYAVIHSGLGKRWRHVVLVFIIAGGCSAVIGLYYYANGMRLGIGYMFDIDLKYLRGLELSSQISPDLRGELEEKGLQLSQDAIISPSKYGRCQIVDKERERRYAIWQRENHLSVYMIERRLAGTFKAPNDLGAYLALLVPMTVGYLAASWRVGPGWGFIVLFVGTLWMMTINLALTLTRGAWIGVFAATIWMISIFDRRLLLGLLVIVLISPFIMPTHVKARFQTLIEQPPGFISKRPGWWKTSVQWISKYPITGIGLGRFHHEYELYAPQEMPDVPHHAHNIYLHIAAEHGIPSLLLFLWMVFLIFRELLALRRSNDFWRLGLFLGGSAFLVSLLVYGLADHTLHRRPLLMFWFISGVIFYQRLIDTKEPQINEEKVETC